MGLGTGALRWSTILDFLGTWPCVLRCLGSGMGDIFSHNSALTTQGALSCNWPACFHLRTLAECPFIERLLGSHSRVLVRAPTKVSAGIAPGCAHGVTILRTAWKRVLALLSQPGTSGLVLDHRPVCLGLGRHCVVQSLSRHCSSCKGYRLNEMGKLPAFKSLV